MAPRRLSRSVRAITLALLGGVAGALVACERQAPAPSTQPSAPVSPRTIEKAPNLAPAAPQDAPDRFYPGFDAARDALPAPRRGGRVVVHLDALPRSLNYLVDNNGMTRRIQQEVHATLLARDVVTTRIELVLAQSMLVEDTLVLRDGTRLHGRVEQRGEVWHVEAAPQEHPSLAQPRDVPVTQVERVDRGSLFTFVLRPGVKWHDGRPLRVEDFLFTLRMIACPAFQCGEQRFQFAAITAAEKLDERTLRVAWGRQYFLSTLAFETLTPLPAHLYDLRDPAHPQFDPNATDEAIARAANEHPRNRDWIGLGPYRVTAFTNEWIEATRFEDYFDPAHGGWFDTIRWRVITDPAVAFRALLEGEVDFSASLLSEDYFGRAASDPVFTERFYRGYYYTPRMGYLGWNTARPRFSDARVRTALALCFDWDRFIASFYSGLAERVTAEWFDGGADYDRTLAPLPFDPARARRLLNEAGWYDRDGDGWIDRDGESFTFSLLLVPGKSSEAFAQQFQRGLEQVGVQLRIEVLDWAALSERVTRRDFDALYKAWVMPIESDPEQRWHSRQIGPGTANETSFGSAATDELIERIQRELDPAQRGRLAQELQRTLYAQQAYMYGVKVPVKFAMSKRIRNLRIGPVDPGYRIRDWYFVEPLEGR